MRKLSVAMLAFTLVLAGSWTALALYRWEWTRALWMTMAFVVAEVAPELLCLDHRRIIADEHWFDEVVLPAASARERGWGRCRRALR